MVRTLGKVAESWLTDPNRTVEAQTRLSQDFLTLWGSTYQKLQGQQTPPVAAPEPRDNRFAHPDWSENPYFDFIKQGYLIATRWAEDLVEDAEGIDEHTRHKAQFYLRQVTSMLSPSNFLATNPELIRHTSRRTAPTSCAASRCTRRTCRPGTGRCACARPTRPGSRSAATWR